MNIKRLELTFLGLSLFSVVTIPLEAKHKETAKALKETPQEGPTFSDFFMAIVFAAIIEDCNYDVKRIAKMLKAEGCTKKDVQEISHYLQATAMLNHKQIKQIIARL